MKIFIQDRLYVQASDIDFLLQSDEFIPEDIYKFLLGYSINASEYSTLDDFISFTSNRYINFFKSLDYIVDYDDYKDLDISNIENEFEKLQYKINQLELKYNNIDTDEKDELIDTHDKLCNKLYNLSTIILYKSGKINFHIPGEVYKPKVLRRINYLLKKKVEE